MGSPNGAMPTPLALSNMTGNVSQLQAQLLALNSTLHSLQIELADSVELTAHIWRIVSAIFVFLMQLGFSLLEAGTVRFKNTRNIMIKNVLDTCVCAIAFWLLGYGIGFGEGSRVFGWMYPDGSVAYAGGQNGVEWFFQFTFCATSATIIAGAVAERTHLWAYLTFNFFLSALIYPVIAHLIWSDNGLLSASRNTIILNTIGVLDNAGSMVVHVTGGVTSLVGAWMVGPRIGRFDIDGRVVPFKCHSMVFIAAGTIILWVGFYGFNGGSVSLVGQAPLVWVEEVARVCVNTTICASFSGVTVWTLTYRRREPVPEDTFNAVIGGLVSACATSSVVEPYAAAIVGIVAGLAYLFGCWVLLKLQIDDPCQAAPTHLFCGTWGGLAAGLFATYSGIQNTYNVMNPPAWGLLYGGGGWQLLVQILGLLFVYVWVGGTTYLLFLVLGFFGVLRVKRQQEEVGLDVAFHGGEEETDEYDIEDSQYGGRRFLNRQLHGTMPGLLERVVQLLNPKTWGRKGGAAEAGFGQKRDVWHRPLDSTPYGQFSLAMYEANYVMEDTAEVEGSSSGVYMGVHDGHGGTETSEFLKEHLYFRMKDQFMKQGGQVSAEAVRMAFLEAEEQFTQFVRTSFESTPHLATVGACSVTAIVTSNALWVANVGDCRAVLGQVRKSDEGIECRALQLSVDHNLSFPAIREKFITEHADMPDAVVEKRGSYRVKGKVTITRSFGDLYLKSHEFNREPLFSRFRVPEPYNPPLLTAEPNISVRLLSPHDSFVILASDGLFEFVSNQEAVDIVASSPRKDIARQLIRAALRRAAEKREVRYQDLLRMSSGQRREYHDDITVVVFFFNHEVRTKGNKNLLWHHDVSFKGGKDARMALSSSSAMANAQDFQMISSRHGSMDARLALALMNSGVTEPAVPEDEPLAMDRVDSKRKGDV